MNIRSLLSVSLALLVGTCGWETAVAQSNPPAYLFTSFRGNGDGLHLAWSRDAYHWTDFDRVFLKPAVGSKLFRDAHILQGPDGIFRMTWTTGWNDKGIGYASSTNLVDWSEQKYLPFIISFVPSENPLPGGEAAHNV